MASTKPGAVQDCDLSALERLVTTAFQMMQLNTRSTSFESFTLILVPSLPVRSCLRLRKISSIEDANAYAQEFAEDYNKRFSKLPKNAHNAHRPVRDDEDLNLIFTWREPRCVSKSLTVQYDKRLLMLQDTPENRKLASRYIEVYHYPDGSIELRANRKSLPYSVYDRLPEVQEGAIVDNKRLGHALEIAKLMQDKRDNRRSQLVPADGISNRSRSRPPGKKSQRALNQDDLNEAIALAVNSSGKHHASMTTHLGA